MNWGYKINRILKKDDYLSNKIESYSIIKNSDKFVIRFFRWINSNWWLKRIIIYLILICAYIIPTLFVINSISTPVNFINSIILGSNVAGSIATIPLTLVGIIIPMVIILLNVVGTRAGVQNINIYLEYVKPLQIFLISITFLILSVLAYSFGLTNILLIFVIIPLIETILIVKRTIEVVNDKYLYILFEKKIIKELILNIKNEQYDVSYRKKFKEICENKNIKFIPRDSLSADYNPTIPLFVKNEGFITDINLRKLNKFKKDLKEPLFLNDEISNFFAILIKYPGEYVTSGDILGYINVNERKYGDLTISILETELNELFIFEKKEKYKDIYENLQILKDRTVKAIEKNQYTQFERLLHVYMSLIYFYMDYEKKNKTDLNNGYNTGRFLELTYDNFDDIIDTATEAKKKYLIKILTNMYLLFERGVYYQDYNILSIILSIFKDSIYNKSIKAQSDISIQSSFSYPLKMAIFLDRYASKLDNTDLDHLFFQIVNIFINLQKVTITKNDFDTFKEIEKILDNEIAKIKPELDDEIKLNYLSAFSWFLYQIKNDKLEIKTYNKFIKNFISLFGNLNEFLVLFSKIITSKKDLKDYKLDLAIWEDKSLTQEKKRKHIFLFCIIAMKNSSKLNKKEIISLLVNITPDVPLKSIENICEEILIYKEKWSNIIGDDIEEKNENFVLNIRKAYS